MPRPAGCAATAGSSSGRNGLVIVLLGAGLSGLVRDAVVLHIAMWVLAVASLVTLAQRVHTVRTSAGAMDPLQNPCRRRPEHTDAQTSPENPEHEPAVMHRPRRAGRPTAAADFPLGGQLCRLGLRRRLAAGPRDAGIGRPQHFRGRRASTRPVTADPNSCARTWPECSASRRAGAGQADPASLASYARYWREAFRLPTMDLEAVGRRADRLGPRTPRGRARRGRGAMLALPHSGNWDMAGVWLVHNNGTFTTVVERLKPESLYRRFLAYRESLGFEVLPLPAGSALRSRYLPSGCAPTRWCA